VTDHVHQWVAGMMAVPEEDLHEVALMRLAHGEFVECQGCDAIYDVSNPAQPIEPREGS
jgi:hypothetical protein